MKRLFVGIITALCAIAVTAQLVPYRQLSTNEFKVGSFPAVQLRLNPTQFNTGGFPITITNVSGVFGAGGGGSGNVVASGTNDVGWLLTASTNDGIHATWSAPIWTNSPTGSASLAGGITNISAPGAILTGFASTTNLYGSAYLHIVQTDQSPYAIFISTLSTNIGHGYFIVNDDGSYENGNADGANFTYYNDSSVSLRFASILYLNAPTVFSDTITTGDPGSGVAAWRLGKNITGTTATVCVTNWVEVMIGTNVYHLLRANE